ncbi:hypothetical protein ElyMa_002988300 [Elysia marginata]|uniref:Uncharacterized protein n=1 Tax=Elysia marginata TaxID=1093978 RepID=A0AAV4IAD5_9GAST|nr:hypothetical protein ElyMa_002988300 [Elysia marginata]
MANGTGKELKMETDIWEEGTRKDRSVLEITMSYLSSFLTFFKHSSEDDSTPLTPSHCTAPFPYDIITGRKTNTGRLADTKAAPVTSGSKAVNCLVNQLYGCIDRR